MNRLTEKDLQGNWCLKDVPWERLHVGQQITEELWQKLYGALWKLMEYEDTELSPEEIERVNKFEDTPHTCDTCRRYGKSGHNCYYCRRKERPDLWEIKEKAHE